MNFDGTRDNSPFDVDWERGIDKKDKEKISHEKLIKIIEKVGYTASPIK